MTGYPTLLRISRGVFVLAVFVGKFNVLLFALPFVMLSGQGRDASHESSWENADRS
jgi:hypothetical protein